MSSEFVTTLQQWSSSRSPPDASPDAFSSSLTTTVFSQRSMRRLEASPRRAAPKGQQSFISRTAPHQENSPAYMAGSSPRSWHTARQFCGQPISSSSARWSGGSCLVARSRPDLFLRGAGLRTVKGRDGLRPRSREVPAPVKAGPTSPFPVWLLDAQPGQTLYQPESSALLFVAHPARKRGRGGFVIPRGSIRVSSREIARRHP